MDHFNAQADADAKWQAARAKLMAKIAEQDAARGRPLTDTEKLNNLEDALGFERGRLRNRK
jgi:hypothetical protein